MLVKLYCYSKSFVGHISLKFRLLIRLNLNKQNFYIHPLSDFFKASRVLTGMNMYASKYSGLLSPPPASVESLLCCICSNEVFVHYWEIFMNTAEKILSTQVQNVCSEINLTI